MTQFDVEAFIKEQWPSDLPLRNLATENDVEIATLYYGGDFKIIFDPRNEKELEAAKVAFNRLKEQGFLAFNVTDKSKPGEQISTFDPTKGSYIMMPPVAGGK